MSARCVSAAAASLLLALLLVTPVSAQLVCASDPPLRAEKGTALSWVEGDQWFANVRAACDWGAVSPWGAKVANLAALPACVPGLDGHVYTVGDTGAGSPGIYQCEAGVGWNVAGGGAGSDDQTAAEVDYTPAVVADWVDPDPETAADGLDDLAARLTDEEAKPDADDVPEAGDFGALALTGDVTSSGLATTIASNAVALGTDTTGGYAASSSEGGAASSVAANSVALGDDTIGAYAAGDAEAGAALTGDSATSFFPAGQLEDARVDGSAEADEVGIGGDGSGTAAALVVTDDSHAHTGGTISALDAADTATGTFADARISDSSVTQHETALEAVLDLPDQQGQIGDAQIADAAVDGGTGGEIADGSVTAADLGADSVAASELDAGAVEAELEAVQDLQDFQGAVVDSQVPDTITASLYAPLAGATFTGVLGIDNAQGFRLFEADGNGSNYVEFVAPAALTANTTCTLENDGSPIPDSCVGDGTDGGGIGGSTGSTDNRVLRSDGTGGATLQASSVTIDDTGNIGLPASGVPATPTLHFGENTGYYSESADVLNVSINGTGRFHWSSIYYGGDAVGSGYLVSTTASATTPTVLPAGDTDTGIGSAGTNQVSVIGGGVEGLRVDTSAVTSYLKHRYAVQVLTVADDGNAGTKAAATLTPSSSYVECVCNDAAPGGCTITLSETGALQGQALTIVSTTANACEYADTAGVTELAGAFVAGTDDSLSLIYGSASWRETARSNN